MRPDEVTAVIVTRGNVPLDAVLDSLLPYKDVVVWDNSVAPMDFGAFGRCIGAVTQVRTEWVYFQDDDLIVRPEWQRALLDAAEPGVLTVNMPKEDYRPGDVRPWLHHLVWQGWGGIMRREDVLNANRRWVDAGGDIDADYYIVGGDVVLGTLYPHKRLDIDAGRSTGLHGDARPRTSAMADDFARKTKFYVRCCEILGVDDLDEIRAAVAAELQPGAFRG
jgi:hypothetical protein